MAPPAAWEAMVKQTRNLGRPGITSMGIAAVDLALWALKARLLGPVPPARDGARPGPDLRLGRIHRVLG
jgi:hypothetical protein